MNVIVYIPVNENIPLYLFLRELFPSSDAPGVEIYIFNNICSYKDKSEVDDHKSPDSI